MGEYQETVETILVEESAQGDNVTGRLLAAYPDARVLYYTEGAGVGGTAPPSGNPKKTLVLKRHRGRFVKPFPRHPWHGDGESANLILGHGCFASCLYCFVFTYFESPNPTLFTNLDDALAELGAFLRENPRAWISTGEFMDSLQLDSAAGYNQSIIEAMAAFPGATLELRTKHSGAEHIPPCGQRGVVFSFSVNPDEVVRRVEPGSADLGRRLRAAAGLHGRGYRIALRIDPIIPTAEYAGAYDGLAGTVEKQLGWERVSRVFLGSLRFDAELMKKLSRGPASRKLLDAEYVLTPDGKYRVYKHARVAAYRRLVGQIRTYAPEIKVTLMMEPDYVRESVLKDG